MDAKDRRIAELEKANAVLTAEVKQLKSRPVLEADVLASFGAFDTNRDGLLTKDEVVAVLTRDTGAGYAMTREAAEAKWTEWVQRHDADSDGKLSYKEIAAGITHQPRKPAYMEAVKKTVKDFPFLELAGGAFAIASKVSKEVYEVDTLYGILMRGEAKIGEGTITAELLKGKYTPGVPLKGACPIVTDNHLGLHDAALVDWRSAYGTYAAATTIGAIIFAGDAEGFATWAKSKPCRDEVAGVPDGRLWALIDGYIVSVEAQAGLAAATVANGKGSIVWASGDYYVGEIRGGLRNGEGTWTEASGDKYIGQFKDGKFHGTGTYTWASGTKYVGEMFKGDFHGKGTITYANGTVTKGRWEHDEFKG